MLTLCFEANARRLISVVIYSVLMESQSIFLLLMVERYHGCLGECDHPFGEMADKERLSPEKQTQSAKKP